MASYYFIKADNKPITSYQLDDMIKAGTVDGTKSLEEQGIYNFDNTYYPTKYLENQDIFTVSAKDNNGVDQYEYYEETKEVEVPVTNIATGPTTESNTTTTTITVKGYRFKWTLVAKDKDTIKPLLLTRLTTKKLTVENSGVKLADGTVIQSAESDRSRISQLMHALEYLKLFNPEDTEFKQYLDELKFKVTEGVYVAVSEEQILYFFKVMAMRTLACFERENVIAGLIETASDANTMAAAYFDNIDTGWPA